MIREKNSCFRVIVIRKLNFKKEQWSTFGLVVELKIFKELVIIKIVAYQKFKNYAFVQGLIPGSGKRIDGTSCFAASALWKERGVLSSMAWQQRCGTVTIFYCSGSGSYFWQIMFPVPTFEKVMVPVPTYEKLRFRFQFRFRFQLHI